MNIKVVPLLLAAPLLFALVPAHAQDRAAPSIGVAAAVNAYAEELPLQGEARSLLVGADIEQGERITTDENGQAQLLFVDGSSFTIGNRASVVVDDFVYDGSAQRGHLGLSLGKGVFRFIGGHLSKDGSVQVRTPTALLGIRGAVVLIEVKPDSGETLVTLIYGDHVLIRGLDGATEAIRRAGYSSVIRRDAPPTPPSRLAPERFRELERKLESHVPRPHAEPAAWHRPRPNDQISPVLIASKPPFAFATGSFPIANGLLTTGSASFTVSSAGTSAVVDGAGISTVTLSIAEVPNLTISTGGLMLSSVSGSFTVTTASPLPLTATTIKGTTNVQGVTVSGTTAGIVTTVHTTQ